MRKAKGFTLLETLLAVTIIIMILGTVYSFYDYSVTLTIRGRERLEDIQLARAVVEKIAGELQSVTSSGSRFSAVLRGDPDKVSFLTTVVPSRLVFFPRDLMDRGRVIEHDLRNVTYYLSRESEGEKKLLGLGRDELRCLLTPIVEKKEAKDLTAEEVEKEKRERDKFKVHFDLGGNQALSEQPVIQQALLSDRIKFLQFDYFDGNQWSSTWKKSGADALPRAVRVTVGFTEVPEEDFKREQLLSYEDRPWRDDQYSLVVSLILSDDLKAQYSTSETEGTE